MTLRELLQQEASQWRYIKAPAGAWMMPEFVSRMGVDCIPQKLPDLYAKGKPKNCFNNAAFLSALFPDLRYCEGFAVHPRFPLQFHHAWCLDSNNYVVDTTLDKPEEYEFLGVIISEDDYETQTYKHNVFSVLDTGCGVNAKFMVDKCPELCEFLTEDEIAYINKRKS